MIDERDERADERPLVDADISGHLATAMFIGVILLMLVFIYALTTAA